MKSGGVHGFVRAVWVRMVAMRALEAAGIGAGIAAMLGAVLMAVMMIQGRSGWEIACAIVALGVAVGLGWGIVKRPSRLQAAGEADRQFQLKDLLVTAVYAPQGNSADEWSASVVGMAEARCERLRAAIGAQPSWSAGVGGHWSVGGAGDDVGSDVIDAAFIDGAR